MPLHVSCQLWNWHASIPACCSRCSLMHACVSHQAPDSRRTPLPCPPSLLPNCSAGFVTDTLAPLLQSGFDPLMDLRYVAYGNARRTSVRCCCTACWWEGLARSLGSARNTPLPGPQPLIASPMPCAA